MKYAPVILFAYNRPEHTRLTLQSLKKNALAEDSGLFIYADGPKADADAEQRKKIEEVRSVAREDKWCGEVTIIESDENRGLAASVIHGVTETVNKFGKVIVLEDDLVSDRFFLKFMNDALELYEKNENVIGATGYIYPVKQALPETFFLRGADCWGWATWKRGWDLLEKDGRKLLLEIEKKNYTNDFDFFGSYPYTQMLRDQIEGKNNSWAILWYASAYLQNKLTLYPGESLIQNIGVDGSGTHSGVTDQFKIQLKGKELKLVPGNSAEDERAKKVIAEYFGSIRGAKKTFFDKVISKIKNR
jgi:hypothetical protein